jgi:hypothetical protein
MEPPYVPPWLLRLPIIGRFFQSQGLILHNMSRIEVGDYVLEYRLPEESTIGQEQVY